MIKGISAPARACTLLLAWVLAACSAGSAAAPGDPGERGNGGTAGTAPPSGGAAAASAGGASGTPADGDAGTDAGARLAGADYFVPAGPDTPEQRYPIESPTLKIAGDEFRIDYKLPQLLVGDDQSVSLRGALDAQRRIATVSGDAGTATCDLMPGGGLTLRCDESLTGISVDLDAVGDKARTADPTHATLLIAIARRFASEPIGVLEVR